MVASYERLHLSGVDPIIYVKGEGWERSYAGGNQVVFQNSLGRIMKIASKQSAK